MENQEIKNNNRQKTLKIVLLIIGIILVFSAVRSFYFKYKEDKEYEEKGWQTVKATCTEENSYIRITSRRRGFH